MAYERGTEYIVIDLEKWDDLFELKQDIEIKLASEPWWLSPFWRRNIVIVVPLWTLIYFGYVLYSYLTFKDYRLRQMSWLDRKLIILEHFNHVKDFLYFLGDHAYWFIIILFEQTLIFPFVRSLGEGGSITRQAYYGFNQSHKYYARARWLIKTNVCWYENIPQIYLILIETFLVKKTITIVQTMNPAISLLMSIRHLGRVTGESFASEKSMTAEVVNSESSI